MAFVSFRQPSLHVTSPEETTEGRSTELWAGHLPRTPGREQQDFCLASCHATRSGDWVALGARGHPEQKARATLEVKTLPPKVCTVVIFQEKQTNVPTALVLKISSHKFEC